MDPVKRKVFSELFLAPSVVLPIVGGLSAGMLSWAGGGVQSLSMIAAVGILGGLGWMATRIIFGIEKITEETLRFQMAEASRQENRELDWLARQLKLDSDHRTQDYLTLLRSLRDEVIEIANRPEWVMRASEVRSQIQEVFTAAVKQLREAFRQWELAQKLKGVERQKVLADREKVLQEISETVDQMRAVVSHFKSTIEVDQSTDLSSLRDELDASLRVAKRTEERLKELDKLGQPYDNESSSRE